MLSVGEGFDVAAEPRLGAHAPVTEVLLIAPEDFDLPVETTAEDSAAAAPIDAAVAPWRSYFTAEDGAGEVSATDGTGLPDLVDHRPRQSTVKHQQRRNTCVSHASLGLLEAMPRIPKDLSEQYAHYKFMTFLNLPHDQDRGLVTTDAARFLSRADGLVCTEEEWPYVQDAGTVAQLVHAGDYGPPPDASANQTYGYASYKLIDDAGSGWESIRNPQYLEALLATGFDIAVGVWVAWDERANTLVLDLVTDPATGGPIKDSGHAMLVVGYDRLNRYFILKNSWGSDWGHAGYGYFSYGFASAAFKYGFTVSEAIPGSS